MGKISDWNVMRADNERAHRPKVTVKAARLSMTYLPQACQILRIARKVNSGSQKAANRNPMI
jgi:hypothetical protein